MSSAPVVVLCRHEDATALGCQAAATSTGLAATSTGLAAACSCEVSDRRRSAGAGRS